MKRDKILKSLMTYERCFPEANLELQGWLTTQFTNLLVLTRGLRYFSKRGNIKKGRVEIED